MTDVESVYNLLLAKSFQEELFSTPTRRTEKAGTELVKDCPFCGKEGHLYVSTVKPFYHCFSCNESGDWITYLQKTKGLSFLEALALLAEKAGVKIEGYDEAKHVQKTRRATLIESAQRHFIASLRRDKGQEVLNYLRNTRGYSEADINSMELGAYTDREELKEVLRKEGFTDQEIQASGLFTAGLGVSHQLAILWRDVSGRGIGIAGRSILPEEELKARGLQKYVNAAGLEKSKAFIGLERIHKSKTKKILLVEGQLDALLLNSREPTMNAVALGGLTVSQYQLQALEDAGVKNIIISLDNDDAGQKATEDLIKSLMDSSIHLFVARLPEGIKDLDELMRSNRKEEAESVEWSRWMPERIFQKYQIESDIGYREALDESIGCLAKIGDPLDKKIYLESLSEVSGLDAELIKQETSRMKSGGQEESEKLLLAFRKRLDSSLKAKDYLRVENDIQGTLEALQKRRGAEIPEPYLLADYLRDLKETPPSLKTGFKELDDLVRIPQGAVTVIAGRPRHGKTTMMINLLLRMSGLYPDRRFYFYSYELPKNKIATMIIMALAKIVFDGKGTPNFDLYEEYLKAPTGIKGIDQAVHQYDDLTSSGRLYIVDRPLNESDLKQIIIKTSDRKNTGAVFIDYLQKIPLSNVSAQRYVEVKQASEALRQAAVSCNIPIITGAQLGRTAIPPNASKELRRPRLENLRESGDIEQDASLVLAVFNEDAERQDSGSPSAKADKTGRIEIHVLKNRLGKTSGSCSFLFKGETFSIEDDPKDERY